MDERHEEQQPIADVQDAAQSSTAGNGEIASNPSSDCADSKHERRRRYVKRIAYDGVFAALALGMFVVEMQVPLPLPIPGVKLGLSNIVSLFAMFALSPIDAAVILLIRIGLGSLFSGSLTAFLYSLAGGALCYAVTLLMYFVLNEKQIWVAGVFGAVSHVTAQVAVAAGLTQTGQVFYYLPVLVSISIATGALTGFLAQFVYLRTHSFFADYHNKKNKKA